LCFSRSERTPGIEPPLQDLGYCREVAEEINRVGSCAFGRLSEPDDMAAAVDLPSRAKRPMQPIVLRAVTSAMHPYVGSRLGASRNTGTVGGRSLFAGLSLRPYRVRGSLNECFDFLDLFRVQLTSEVWHTSFNMGTLEQKLVEF